MKHYCPTGRRNHGRPLRRLLDTWDRNGSQVAQLHDRYRMMMMMMMMMLIRDNTALFYPDCVFCSAWISQQTAIISLNRISRSVP
jgi:hypothetical protein